MSTQQQPAQPVQPIQQQQQPISQQPQPQPQQQQQQQHQQQQQAGDSGRKASVSFGSLMPYLSNLVSPEQNVQLNAVYKKLKNNEISREDFVRGARLVAGEQLILKALKLMNNKVAPSSVSDDAEQTKRIPSFEPAGQSASKKAKLDPVHSLEQINDVTAVGGVNLKEEEERLLTAPREESRTTAEMRRKFLEEDGRFFLEKGPLHNKVQEIAAKAGLKSISEDVERCLSMSAEEWLWNFLLKSVKASKQRCDVEKDRHRIMVSLDFQKQIMAMRKEQREFRQRKQAEEAERLRKLEEEKGPATEEGKDGSTKTPKGQQQDDKMRTTAANLAARKAIGGDDTMSKWMLMAAEQQKRDAWGNQKSQEQGAPTPGNGGTPRVNARRSALPQAPKPIRSIILKDLVACLEREPGMCKSSLLYRLYEKLATEASQL